MNKMIMVPLVALGVIGMTTGAQAAVSPSTGVEAVYGSLSHGSIQDGFNIAGVQYEAAVHAAVADKMRSEEALRQAVVSTWVAEAQAKTPVAPVAPVEQVYYEPAPVTPTYTQSPVEAVTAVPSGTGADAWASSAMAQSVIQCESGGNYSINTGNGYYGAWQFDYGTWQANGGGQYAATADQATPSQQNQIAYNTYQSRGWQPWECAQ